MKRKSLSKQKRTKIWEAFNKKCAYCGCDLEYKDMQIDHVKSVLSAHFKKITEDELNNDDNLLPSCRMCNYYKGASNIEEFRKTLKNTLSHTCVDTFQAKLALKYRMLKIQEWDGVFYFEKYKMGE